jgi:hypothetical protein
MINVQIPINNLRVPSGGTFIIEPGANVSIPESVIGGGDVDGGNAAGTVTATTITWESLAFNTYTHATSIAGGSVVDSTSGTYTSAFVHESNSFTYSSVVSTSLGTVSDAGMVTWTTTSSAWEATSGEETLTTGTAATDTIVTYTATTITETTVTTEEFRVWYDTVTETITYDPAITGTSWWANSLMWTEETTTTSSADSYWVPSSVMNEFGTFTSFEESGSTVLTFPA